MNNKHASDPELYVRSKHTQTEPRISSMSPKSSRTTTSVLLEDPAVYYTQSNYTQYSPPSESRSVLVKRHRPRLEFIGYVYVLLAIQVGLSTLQWLMATYRWRPQLNGAERNFHMLLLLLIWLNLTLAFFGFRRLQTTPPLNWIVFACMFESLALFLMCLSMRELDLTWQIVLASFVVLLLYTPLGLWVPPLLTLKLWILVFESVTVLIFSILALATTLAMHLYVPFTLCLMLFGPWTMYNTFQLIAVSRENYWGFSYLKHAARMYIAFGLTVGGLVVATRIAYSAIESESCRALVFCPRKSTSLTYGPAD